MPHIGTADSGQSNHSLCSISEQVNGLQGLENGIGVKEESRAGKNGLADNHSWHSIRSSIGAGAGLGGSQMSRLEQLGEFQRSPRRARGRGSQCKGGNMSMPRGRGLARAVRGELEKSAQAGQASMQV